MKAKTILIAIIIFIAFRLDAIPAPEISLGLFYDSLRPYGEWIQLESNLTVWRPQNIYPNWRPYSVGRWYWSDQGWYWDSDEPFGWATYHYGRWFNDDYYGWIWIPDNQWGPSWVEWRYNDDYIGWAPLPPYASFQFDLGIHFSIGWHSNYGYWNFISYNHFCDRRMHDFLLDDFTRERVFHSTRYRTNYYADHDRIINGGIDRNFIERRGGSRISERQIRNVGDYNEYSRFRSSDGERGDRITAYRPSEREIGRGREINREEIKRGETRSSLQRDRIFSRDDNSSFTRESNTPRNSDLRTERNQTENRNSNQIENRNRMSERNNNFGQSWRDQREQNKAQREILRERPQNTERQQSNNRSQFQQRDNSPRQQPSFERPSQRSERSRSENRETPRRENRSSEERRR
jgi:hypothetical protein